MTVERISIIENFIPKEDEKLLAKAATNTPDLKSKDHAPEKCFLYDAEKGLFDQEITLEEMQILSLGAGDSVILDFGSHMVGYYTMQIDSKGSHPDAPAYLRIQFAEVSSELLENAEKYHGWISKSWIQEETLHLDKIPAMVMLPRRYAFRYVKITVIDTSKKYRLCIPKTTCRAVSCVDMSDVSEICLKDDMLNQIDRISVKTLAECMQEVFEDGPKRDRRLWLGDFRLQALVNYCTFRRRDIVKRCLYLFAGTRFTDDRIAACIFTDGEATADDTWFSDYSLFYPVALEEYLRAFDDPDLLKDVYDIALLQIDRALEACKEEGLDRFAEASFIDWCPGLDKHACILGVILYALPYGIDLARRMRDDRRCEEYKKALQAYRALAMQRFWNKEEKCFISNGQKSLTTQIWMVLGGVLPKEESGELLTRFSEQDENYPMTSPYMHHYYLEALLYAGLKEKATLHLKEYWGSMVVKGADTFWEIWNPRDPDGSPYGGTIVNSFCHAWSCTPAMFLRNGLALGD